MSARPFSILDAISDQRLFGQAFRDLSTWRAWLVFLAGLFALPMSEVGGSGLARMHWALDNRRGSRSPRVGWFAAGGLASRSSWR